MSTTDSTEGGQGKALPLNTKEKEKGNKQTSLRPPEISLQDFQPNEDLLKRAWGIDGAQDQLGWE